MWVGVWKSTENLNAQMQKSKEDSEFYHEVPNSFSEKYILMVQGDTVIWLLAKLATTLYSSLK